MNWKMTTLVLTVMGAALGISCIEDGYDPLRPAVMSSRSPRPSSEFPVEGAATSDFPSEVISGSRR